MRLKRVIVKTFDRIVDPYKTVKITRDLFNVKNLLSKIPNSKSYLEILSDEFKLLKNSWKYKISDDNN